MGNGNGALGTGTISSGGDKRKLLAWLVVVRRGTVFNLTEFLRGAVCCEATSTLDYTSVPVRRYGGKQK